MKRYSPTLKDMFLQHHTERNVLIIKIIRGKDHSHLIINESGFKREFISKNFKEVLDYSIELLQTYRKLRNKVWRHNKRRELE